ncbi:MAG: isoamylase early set domain-containing protein [Desulfobulbaceae bacterium]|nr:isoamylase early set domain-containing protein [Desulfobulbaceae bacterium]
MTFASKNRAPAKTKKNNDSTEFSLIAPEAKEVFLVGEFNDWNGDGFKMRRYKNGVFKKKTKLQPGKYEYRFVVDGEWWNDPNNPNRRANSFGSENSVMDIC